MRLLPDRQPPRSLTAAVTSMLLLAACGCGTAAGPPDSPAGPDESPPPGWFDFVVPHEPPPPGLPSIRDVRELLDAPAGKHGFLHVEGEGFAFEDGTPFTVFGTNLTYRTSFPPCDTEDGSCQPGDSCPLSAAMAERLASFGINTVRLHHLDYKGAGVGIFDAAGLQADPPSTLELDAGQLSRLGCLINELEQRGIYININTQTMRKYFAGDGVIDWDRIPKWGAKRVFWDSRIKQLSKRFNRQLLREWVNPFTGLTLADDPGVAFVELLNENSLIVGWATGRTTCSGPGKACIPDYYRGELDELWATWLADHDPTGGWEDGTGVGLGPGESAPDAVARLDPAALLGQGFSLSRYRDTLRFHAEVATSYWDEMSAHLRDTAPGGIGLRVPISTSNNAYRLLHQQLVAAHSDYGDVHFYWDHPSGGLGGEQHNLSSLRQAAAPGREHVPIEEQLAAYATRGRPTVVSETSHPWPNEWRAEAAATAMYLAFQGYAGMYGFCWEAIRLAGPDPEVWSTDFVDNNFSSRNDPVALALLPTMAMAFLRGDIAAGEQELTLRYTPDEVLDAYAVADEIGWQVAAGGLPTQLAYLFRVRRDLSPEAAPAKPLSPADYLSALGLGTEDPRPPFVSSSGELLLDADVGGTPAQPGARLVVSAPRLQGAIGDFDGQTESRAPLLDLTVHERFAAVLLASRDGRPLDTSSLMLLTTVARGENTGQSWNASRTNYLQMGHGPTRLERVTGTVTLRGRAGLETLAIYQTDGRGFKTRRVVPEVQSSSELRFAIGGAAWYAIGTEQALATVR